MEYTVGTGTKFSKLLKATRGRSSKLILNLAQLPGRSTRVQVQFCIRDMTCR
eukprot:SAG11_NODE_15182_length_586_cov_1.209446_1_plen_52_part_00